MRNYLLLIVLFTGSLAAKAQESWSLERCIVYAIEHSVDMQQADYAIADADIINDLNRQQRYPNLTAGTNAFWNTGRTVDPTTNDFISTTFFSNGLQLNTGVTLFNGGRINNTIKQGQLSQEAAQEDKASTINTITLNVLAAYFEALFAQDDLVNQTVQRKTIVDQIDQMNKMVEAGTRAKFEIYDLEAQLAQADQSVTLAQNRIDLAIISLKGVMNLDSQDPMELTEPPVDQAVYSDLTTASFEEILDRVIAARPELRAFDLRVQSAELGVDLAKADLYPSLTFGVSFSSNFSNQFKQASEDGSIVRVDQNVFLNGNPATIGTDQFIPSSVSTLPWADQIDENKSLGFGFNLNIPIYNRNQTKGGINRAKLNVLNQQAERERYSINLRNTLGGLITDVKAAERAL
ncbi:MAG: TolC family protein, partial [Bacteroidota bacterium]